ncbi:hypothetical protein BU16DRAFT_614560 [Lophium mytilinum]|uniref:N-acetyltransferase domain-containing protein n=1 Tax=Lophium mytilinum TaxID=390894 RepID=A0A6A6RAT6_9PEZI|nr:hypothetical protein BU16DRAFT_614560 [Lophium mytilinum]
MRLMMQGLAILNPVPHPTKSGHDRDTTVVYIEDTKHRNGVSITTGGLERIEAATEQFSKAFESDPTIAYCLANLTREQRDNCRPRVISAIITAAILNAGTIDEVNGWKCCGAVLTPGHMMDDIMSLIRAGMPAAMWSMGFKGCYRAIMEMGPLSMACKEKVLPGKGKCYYILYVATAPSGRRQGLCSALVKNYQQLAERDKVPIYLEATSKYSCCLYQKLGFSVVDEMIVGKGKHAADGRLEGGGPGVKIWGMIWRPEIRAKEWIY